MNPLTNVKNQQKLNERELALGLTNKKSWHDQYRDSAWVFIGGLPYDLTEGDVVCVFSQYGEIVNINLVRDQKSGKSKGFCFMCYEDQRSTILAVDNLNGFKLLGRVLRVDHVEEYKKPKEHGDEDDITMKLRQDGCAPRVPDSPEMSVEEDPMPVRKIKKEKKVKKEKKDKKKSKKKKVKQSSSESETSESETEVEYRKNLATNVRVKKEKHDPGYEKALKTSARNSYKRSVSPEAYDDQHKKQKHSKHDTSDRNNRDSHDQQNRGQERGNRRDTHYDDFESRLDNNRNKNMESYRRENDRGRENDRDRENDRGRENDERHNHRGGDYNDRGSRNEVYDTNRRRNDYTDRESERYERDRENRRSDRGRDHDDREMDRQSGRDLGRSDRRDRSRDNRR